MYTEDFRKFTNTSDFGHGRKRSNQLVKDYNDSNNEIIRLENEQNRLLEKISICDRKVIQTLQTKMLVILQHARMERFVPFVNCILERESILDNYNSESKDDDIKYNKENQRISVKGKILPSKPSALLDFNLVELEKYIRNLSENVWKGVKVDANTFRQFIYYTNITDQLKKEQRYTFSNADVNMEYAFESYEALFDHLVTKYIVKAGLSYKVENNKSSEMNV